MDVQQLIEDARADGVIIVANGDELRTESTKKNRRWVEKLCAHKHEVLRVLQGGPAGDPKLSPNAWDDPVPLPDPLPSVAAYSTDLLPADVGDAVSDIAERMQCPPDLVAASMLVAMAAVVGCQLAIRPRRFDDWTVVPNLWGFVVGRPSLKKTPATAESMKQIRRIEDLSREKLAPETEQAEIEMRMIPDEIKTLRAKLNSELKKSGRSSPEASQLAEQIKDLDEFEPPVPRRIMTTDPTIEKLADLLNTHRAGMLLFVDELLGWMRGLDRDAKAGVRQQYLTLWNGVGKLNIDRIARGETVVESPCLSIFGCCTPGGLSEYVGHALRGGRGDDGLIQRFQISVWPDSPTSYQAVDRQPNVDAQTRLAEVFDRLAGLEPGAIGRPDPQDPTGIPYLRFASDAQGEFNAWDSNHQHRLRAGELPEAIESHVAKYASMMPSIALILHLAKGGTGPVDLEATEMAIRWTKYLESHAMRIYSIAESGGRQHAAKLLKHLVKRKNTEPIRVRSIRQKGWEGLTSTEAVEAALNALAEAGWVRAVEHKPSSGRPTVNYEVHPEAAKFFAQYERRARKTPETSNGRAFDGFEGDGSADTGLEGGDSADASAQGDAGDHDSMCGVPF